MYAVGFASLKLFGRPFAREALDRIGYLPEERGLYLKLKVVDVMTYFARLKGLDRAEARRRSGAWLERVGLPEVARRKVETLSKGMSQKVQIASALLAEPELCVLDEPFSGLDPVNVRMVQELILDRRRAGRTTILSTHQMNMVETLCDRVALIDKGRLMVYGGVDEVRRRFSRPEVRVSAEGSLGFQSPRRSSAVSRWSPGVEASVESASSRSALRRKPNTRRLSRKRTSDLVGCTLTSTCAGFIASVRKATG